MWQPLNMGKADILRQDWVIQPSKVCFLFFAHSKPMLFIQLLFSLAGLVEMSSECSVLYPSMKIIYVLSDRHKHAFGVDVRLATTHELSEGSVFFPQSKGSFSLNTAIDSEPDPFFTGDPLQTFLALLLEFPRYVQLFKSLFLRRLPVRAFDAFRLVRAALAFIASINCHFAIVSACTLLVIYAAGV